MTDNSAPTSVPIDSERIVKAVRALNLHLRENKASSSLFDESVDYVLLVFSLKKISSHAVLKPYPISLSHTLYEERIHSVCLFTKDPQRKYKDAVKEEELHAVTRVVGVSKLKGKFKTFEAKRDMVKTYDIFLADRAVMKVLPQLLGSSFIRAKKFPQAVDLSKKKIRPAIEAALKTTQMYLNTGNCVTVKVARCSNTESEMLDNITRSIPQIVEHLKGGWENIDAVYLKTTNSPSLPLWADGS